MPEGNIWPVTLQKLYQIPGHGVHKRYTVVMKKVKVPIQMCKITSMKWETNHEFFSLTVLKNIHCPISLSLHYSLSDLGRSMESHKALLSPALGRTWENDCATWRVWNGCGEFPFRSPRILACRVAQGFEKLSAWIKDAISHLP